MSADTNSIPYSLRVRGLLDAHTRPFAAELKTSDGSLYPQRVDPRTAFRKPYVEINPANAWSTIVLDCDDFDAYASFWLSNPDYPKPSFTVRNRTNEHQHCGWILRTPVQRNDAASLKAQRYISDVATRMTHALGADPAYNGVLTRNPAFKHETLETTWGTSRIKGYTLDQLTHELPKRADLPIVDSGIGRNVTLFDSLMTFAGSPSNVDADLYAVAITMNATTFDTPLPLHEVASTAKSVTRYRRNFSYYDHDWRTQRTRAYRSHATRRSKNIERDRNIVALYAQGRSIYSIARELGIDDGTVDNVLKRDYRRYRWEKLGRESERDTRDRNIVALHVEGRSNRSIARELGIAEVTVRRALKRVESASLAEFAYTG